jgi:hypothetical protein
MGVKASRAEGSLRYRWRLVLETLDGPANAAA